MLRRKKRRLLTDRDSEKRGQSDLTDVEKNSHLSFRGEQAVL